MVDLSPAEEPAVPRPIDIDAAAITRLDGREEWDPVSGHVRQRMTVGTAPDGTPVLLVEAPPPSRPARWRRCSTTATTCSR